LNHYLHSFVSHELKIVEADREFLGDKLPDKGVDHAEALTRTGGADDDSAAEDVADIDPALPHLLIIIEKHRDID